MLDARGFPVETRQDPRTISPNTHLWTFAHQSAIANADVVVALGGTVGTDRAMNAADQLGVPVLPIRCFGGAAEQGYKTMESKLLQLQGVHVLSTEWTPDSAPRLVNLIERVGIHSYFISYSHAYVEWCDLVHLSLYLRGRTVLRDRTELEIGRSVQTRLMELIGKAETFVLLWGKKTAESDWCKKEIDHSLMLHNLNLAPRRIVMLRKDKTPPPEELKHLLWFDAKDRQSTDFAVYNIINSEVAQ